MSEQPPRRRELYRPLTVDATVGPGDPVPGDNGERDVVTVTVGGRHVHRTLTVYVYESPDQPGVLVVDVDGGLTAAGPVTAVKLVVNDEDVFTAEGDDPDQLGHDEP